jgi:hypothetical protein
MTETGCEAADILVLCIVCMHITKGGLVDLAAILAAISHMSGPELARVREAVERQRKRLAQSTVVERRSFGSGILQLEYRTNPKTGTKRGPYWYFHLREAGQQRTLYVGKTDDPEQVLAQKLG